MNKIKRGVSLLLCSLLFGSAVTLGNVADVQAGNQYRQRYRHRADYGRWFYRS